MAEHVAKETANQEVSIDEMKTNQERLRVKAERKRLESFWWAAVIIWAGLVFFADYLEVLPEIGEANAWSWILLGAGIFGLLGALIRVTSITLPKPSGWDYFWSAVFLIFGAGGFVGGGVAFPIVLIVVGLAILGNVFVQRD